MVAKMATHRLQTNGAVEAPPEPPESTPPVERITKSLTSWKAIAAVALSIGSIGWALAVWERSVAKREDLAAEHVYSSHVDNRVGLLEVRVVKLETSLEWIQRTLYSVAQATGARTTPPPVETP